jgi:hypothetical protein
MSQIDKLRYLFCAKGFLECFFLGYCNRVPGLWIQPFLPDLDFYCRIKVRPNWVRVREHEYTKKPRQPPSLPNWRHKGWLRQLRMYCLQNLSL